MSRCHGRQPAVAPPIPMPPLYITMHARDNVAIVANDGGLPAGTHVRRRASRCATACRRATRSRWSTSPPARGAPLRRDDRPRARERSPPAAGCTSGCCEMPEARSLDGLPIATRQARAAAAARGLHLRGLSQCRRLGRHAQHPGHHDDGAVRRRRASSSRSQRIKAELLPQLPERRRRRRPRAQLRLRRRDRCAGCRDPDPHAAQHQPEPELRRRGDGGQPRLREAAARAAAAAGHRSRSQRRRAARPTRALDVVCLQDDAHVGFMSMIDSIMAPARAHLRAPERAPARDRAGQRRSSSACSAAAATPSPASPPIRRSASAPTCWCAPAPR